MAKTNQRWFCNLPLQALCLLLIFDFGFSSHPGNGWSPNDYYPIQQQYDDTQAYGASVGTWSSQHQTTTAVVTEQQQPPVPAPTPTPMVPNITPFQIALSLRLTCEMNRKLQLGTAMGRQTKFAMNPQSHNIPASPPSSSELSELSEMLTIFHAPQPRIENERTLKGAERWGPELLSYTRQVVDLLAIPEAQSNLVLSLAMIYLDAASSVETLRSNGAPPCPFLTARTVHRLFLSAMIISTQVVMGWPLEHIYSKLEPLHFPAWQMEEMQAWMKVALGDSGHFVTGYQMLKFKQTWERTFQREQPQPSPNDERLKSNNDNAQRTTPSGFFSTQQQAHVPVDDHDNNQMAQNMQQPSSQEPSASSMGESAQSATATTTTAAGLSTKPTAFHNNNRVSVHSG